MKKQERRRERQGVEGEKDYDEGAKERKNVKNKNSCKIDERKSKRRGTIKRSRKRRKTVVVKQK